MFGSLTKPEQRFYNISEFTPVTITITKNDGYSSKTGIRDYPKLREWIESKCERTVLYQETTWFDTLLFESEEDVLMFKLSDWGPQLPDREKFFSSG